MSELQTAQLPQQDITSAIHYLKIASLQDHITFIRQCLPDMTSPLHYITLHCISLHYIELNYITLH